MRKVVVEIVWLTHLFNDFALSISSLVPIFYDSLAALNIAKNPVFHECTKHNEIDCHYVHDCLLSDIISLHHVFSDDQLADILTKLLSGRLHGSCLRKLGVLTPSILRGGGKGLLT